MRRRVWWITTLFFLVVGVNCSEGADSPLLDKIRSATTYIFIKSGGTFVPRGTGFFVGLRIPTKPKSFFLYLVTTKHLLYQPGTSQFIDTIYIRLNKKGGGSELAAIPVKTQGANRTVFVHSDPTVDLVVMPGMPDQTRFDFKFITDEFFLPQEAGNLLKYYEGIEVFYPSLFFLYAGAGGNHPFFRYGRFALIPEEKIMWEGKLTTLYLIETNGFPGENSGAPVFFFWESGNPPGSQSLLKLAGIIQGSFIDQSAITRNRSAIPFSNEGIAAMIPATKLYELLFSDEVRRQRGF